MDVLMTSEIISFLNITSCSIQQDNEKRSYALLAFSNTHISFISSEPAPDFYNHVCVEIRTKDDVCIFEPKFETTVKTFSKHWIVRFLYSPEFITSFSLKEKWQSLLTFHDFKQTRKDIRLLMTKETIMALHLQSVEIQVWVHSLQKNCVLHNVSFSGARFFCTDDFEFDSDDKTVLKMSFIQPAEIASIRAVILRKRSLEIGGVRCFDVAVCFLEPIDLVLLSRLSAYFQHLLASPI